MKTVLAFCVVGLSIFNSLAQNTPPVLASVSSPSIANGYSPSTLYNLVVNFNENSSKRSFRLKIFNGTNPGVIGTVSQLQSGIDTFRQNGMFYLLSDTGSTAAWTFKWTAPSSAGQTISFELVGTAENLGGSQEDVVHTCTYRVTNSSFGLTGTCTKSSQVGIWDNYDNSINMEINPNPSSGRITISYSLQSSENTLVEVLDLSGKAVKELFSGRENPGGSKHEALFDDLIPGLYMVRVTIDDKAFYSKISVH